MIILDAIIPVFGIMFMGTLVERLNILGHNADKLLSAFVFFIALPCTLFISSAKTPMSLYADNWPFVVAYGATCIIIFFIIFLKKSPDAKSKIINSLSVTSPNTTFMGIPVMMVLFGSRGMLAIIITTLFLIIFVIIAVVLLEAECSEKTGSKLKIVFGIIIRNTLVLSIVIGMLFSISGLALPESVDTLFSTMSATTGPVALFAIGMRISFRKPNNIPNLILIDSIKLILMPAVCFILMFILGTSPFMIACGLVLSSLPVAVTTYIIAQKYDTHIQESSDIVISSTVASIITLSVVIAIVQTFYPAVLVN